MSVDARRNVTSASHSRCDALEFLIPDKDVDTASKDHNHHSRSSAIGLRAVSVGRLPRRGRRHQPAPIIPEQLHKITFAAPKIEDFVPMWVTAKALLRRQRQGVIGLAF
jgi:hypothetical protein